MDETKTDAIKFLKDSLALIDWVEKCHKARVVLVNRELNTATWIVPEVTS